MNIKRALIILFSLLFIFIILLLQQLGVFSLFYKSNRTKGGKGEYYYNKDGDKADSMNKKSKELITPDTDPDSYRVLVNKKYPMSSSYVPKDLVVPEVKFSFYGTYERSYMRKQAAKQIEKLFAAAEKDNISLEIVSAYRSYERQKSIYNNNVRTKGEAETEKISAKPGTSEHQTGLAVDISSPSVGSTIEEDFGDSEAGKWVENNAQDYGFIVRYPKDKTDITGYSYEPWHIRYVGKNLASYLYKKQLTLEEYYQTTSKDDQVAEDPVDDTKGADGDVKDEAMMTSAPTPNVDRSDKSYSHDDEDEKSEDEEYKEETSRQEEEEKSSEQEESTPKPTVKLQPTKKPESTVKPKPEKTEKPVQTKAPVQTKHPVATKQPVSTKQPEEPKQPEKTQVPEKETERKDES